MLSLPPSSSSLMDEARDQDDVFNGGGLKPPDIPADPMEFLSRSWSVSALEVSRALAPPSATQQPTDVLPEAIPEEADGDTVVAVAGNNFSFASSATSQMVLERIMSQSQEVSPLTSGRLSHSSGPLNGGGSLSDSPPVSPSDLLEEAKYCRATAKPQQQRHRVGTTRTVGRWLKDRREKKKEAARAHNAQLHAAVSVAAVAAAVAAAAAAAASGGAARTDMAVASAATLVAAQCVEAAEALGAERDHLASVVGSAVSVRTPGDIITLTAAAATALRGAATLKARAMKEVGNMAAVIPVEKGGLGSNHNHGHHYHDSQLRGKFSEGNDGGRGGDGGGFSGELVPEENFLGLCRQEVLARGTELLKSTRKGALHWKLVSVYINQMGHVMLKTKSRHVAGTITKKKKSVIIDICEDLPAWPGRHLLEGGEQRRYFGLRTAEHRVIEFECTSQREYEMWTQGVSRLLSIVNGGSVRKSVV